MTGNWLQVAKSLAALSDQDGLVEVTDESLASLANDASREIRRSRLAACAFGMYSLGKFRALVECIEEYAQDEQFSFSSIVGQNYTRSLCWLAIRGDLRNASPCVAATAPFLDVLLAHMRRDSNALQVHVERLIDKLTSHEDAVSAVVLLHFYGISLGVAHFKTLRNLMNISDKPTLLAFKLARDTRRHQPTAMISGLARTGTSATGELLNLSSQVAFFTELYSPYLGFSPEMYDADVLSAKTIEQHFHNRNNKKIRDKAMQGARIIGDKRPVFLNSWNLTRENFRPEQLRIINVSRSPCAVVASYAKRAERSRQLQDPWHPDRDGFIAQLDMRRQIAALKDIHDSDFQRSVISTIYPVQLTEWDEVSRIFDFLGVRIDQAAANRMKDQLAYNDSRVRSSGAAPLTNEKLALLNEEERRVFAI